MMVVDVSGINVRYDNRESRAKTKATVDVRVWQLTVLSLRLDCSCDRVVGASSEWSLRTLSLKRSTLVIDTCIASMNVKHTNNGK